MRARARAGSIAATLLVYAGVAVFLSACVWLVVTLWRAIL